MANGNMYLSNFSHMGQMNSQQMGLQWPLYQLQQNFMYNNPYALTNPFPRQFPQAMPQYLQQPIKQQSYPATASLPQLPQAMPQYLQHPSFQPIE